MSATPGGTIEFRTHVIPASDTRHQILTDAQLAAIRALVLLVPVSS